MKKYLNKITVLLFLALAWTGCEVDDPELAEAPTSSQVTFTATPSTANPNIIEFNATAEGCKPLWHFGDGATAEGAQVTHAYPSKGDYTVKLTILTAGGMAANTKVVSIARTDPTMLDREDYNFLTGGVNQLEGKTWVFSPVGPVNFGGEVAAGGNNW